MATLNKAVPGADVGVWGTKTNAALDALNTELVGTTATAAAAETPTGSQAKVNTLSGTLPAAYEAKVVRTGAATNDLVGLSASGTLTLRTPAAGTTINAATTNTAGIVTLAGDNGTTASTVVQATDTRLVGKVNGTGITQITALTQAAYDALATKVATTLYVIVG